MNSALKLLLAYVIYANKVIAGTTTADYFGVRTMSTINFTFAGNTVTLKSVSGTRCLAV